jgi:hypothetical protein
MPLPMTVRDGLDDASAVSIRPICPLGCAGSLTSSINATSHIMKVPGNLNMAMMTTNVYE